MSSFETAGAALSEYAKNAAPIDFKTSLDSLEIMEGVMRRFFVRASIEQRMGPQADWSLVDALKTLAAAEKVAKYRHAQLSAVRLASDSNVKMENLTLDELLERIKVELTKLGPIIEPEMVRQPGGSMTEGGSSKSMLSASRSGT